MAKKKKKHEKAAENAGEMNVSLPTAPAKKRKRRFGDRKDGRRLRTLHPMVSMMPYIMPRRSDACNTYADSFCIDKTDAYCRRKRKEGKPDFGILYVIIAAYVRTISQRPAINRFVSGQKIYARNHISVLMVIKREMSLDAPDTSIKVFFEPTDTIDDVYEKFNKAIRENAKLNEKNKFDKYAKAFSLIPGLLLRWTMKFINFLDYFGWLPRALLDISPMHASMIITSMGSLGIKPIYHHIYDFGNLPVFLAYGTKRTEHTLDKNGNIVTHKYVDLKAVTDERICDGYYYASAFKMFKRFVENPELLERPPEEVYEDID
ncbi:MAG: hypothetical protein GX057_01910 [Clostridiales bacterium]|nr:hypothetical protein [Clostridiales bacterium]